MSAPRWAVGMRRLMPGVYLDGDCAIHFDLYDLCVANGYAPTAENADLHCPPARERPWKAGWCGANRPLERVARRALREACGCEIPTTQVEAADENED